MARMFARGTARPSGTTQGPTRHRFTPFRPCAGRGPRAGALALALAVTLVPLAAGGETSTSRGDVLPFDLPGRELLAQPGDVVPRPADLALVFYDPQGALPRGFERFAAEVQSIFRGLGVEASWRVGGDFGVSAEPEVPVILLTQDPDKGRGETRVMGLVRRNQQPQRAVWLFMDGVRFALGYAPKAPVNYEGPIARALARVAAHEIVHAVAPDEPHASVGLMRHSLDKRFLLGRRAVIDARCASSFRTHLTDEWKERGGRGPSATLGPPVVP